MYAWGPVVQSFTGKKAAAPCEDLRVAVTFPRPDGGHGPTKTDVPLSLGNIKDFVPDPKKMELGIKELKKFGFTPTAQGRLTASMKCKRKTFEEAFHIKLEKVNLDINENYAFHSFYFPPQGLKSWTPILKGLIDDVYIQWPHLYASTVLLPTPPKLPIKDFYLEPPKDIASHLKADEVHAKGMRGENVCLAMIDTGFEHKSHPFFNPYSSTVALAGDAKGPDKDLFGHGTGQSANVFSIAPRVNFTGVKIETTDLNDFVTINRAALLEGFYTAVDQKPDIILLCGGADLSDKRGRQLSKLPRNLKALEAEILHAIASGITVVAAAGNGNCLFPAMMREVIAVGGVFVGPKMMQASNIASAYESRIYPGRHVPDICGLVGMTFEQVSDRYIILPIPPGCLMDIKTARLGTKDDDGWAFFSGTSAAAAQIAGVCSLLKEKKRGLGPSKLKEYLMNTAQPVSFGQANPKSSETGIGMTAAQGAAGKGLVDAFEAWQAVK